MVTVWRTLLLLSCYDCDSTRQHYDVTRFKYVLWRRTMHELVMNIHYRTWIAQGRFLNMIRTPSKQWGVCDNDIRHTLVGNTNCRSLRCSWSIACRRCSNYIFILDLTPGFVGLGKGNCKTRQETFKFWDLVRLILEILRYLISRSWHTVDCHTKHGSIHEDVRIWTLFRNTGPLEGKPPASRLFTQPFVQAEIKETMTAPRHWSLWGEFTDERWIPCTTGQ